MQGLSALRRGEETRVNRGKKSISAAVCSLNGGISLQPLLSCLLLDLPGSHLSHGVGCQDKHVCTAKQSPGLKEQNRGCVGRAELGQRLRTRLHGDTGGTVTNTQQLELAEPSRAHPSLVRLSCAHIELGHLTVRVSATRSSAQHISGSHISAVHSSGTHVSGMHTLGQLQPGAPCPGAQQLQDVGVGVDVDAGADVDRDLDTK